MPDNYSKKLYKLLLQEMDQEKSLISQLTLDTSHFNSSNQHSLPIHWGQQSFVASKILQRPRKLPFGSSASRVIKQIEAKQSSGIVGYTNIQKGRKTLGQKTKGVTFGSGQFRFKTSRKVAPGPGHYSLEPAQNIKAKEDGFFSKADRNTRELLPKEQSIGPGYYDYSLKTGVAEKIKQKYKLYQKKHHECLMKIKENVVTNVVDSSNNLHMGYKKSQNQDENREASDKEKINKRFKATLQPLDRFVLRENTKKYMAQDQKQNKNLQNLPSEKNQGNFSPFFLESKCDNTFESYIPRDDRIPGPGTYNRFEVPKIKTESSFFKSGSKRQVFEHSINLKKTLKHRK